jgi:ABC-type Fe3+/spermidine/putrescine transport system ATPase subunit
MLEEMDGGTLSYLEQKAAWEETGKDGKEHIVYAPKKELRQICKNFGLVFQSFHLFPHYTVLKNIIDAPDFDRTKALEQQIELLTMKKEHLENLIQFARGIKWLGVKNMDFTVFDTKKIDEYSKRAKEQWGTTPEYKEFEKKSKDWNEQDQQNITNEFMQIFVEFGQMRALDPSDEQVQLQVKKLQDYISAHFYHCTNEILSSLGKMYSGGGEFTQNIDNAGGEGTAEFSSKAIDIYCNY